MGLREERTKSSAGGGSCCQTGDLVSSKTGTGMTIPLMHEANYPFLHTKHTFAFTHAYNEALGTHASKHHTCADVLKEVDREVLEGREINRD